MNFKENDVTLLEEAEGVILVEVEDMVDDEIDVDEVADGEVDDTVEVDMKVDNEGDVADDDKDVEEVEALENIVIIKEGAWDKNINHPRKKQPF